MRAGLVQLTSGDDPTANVSVTEAFVREAAEGGAELVVTPECTNLMSFSRARQQEVLVREDEDPTLARLREVAAQTGIHLLIGSLGLKGSADERFVNRSFLIGPSGDVLARYDKIHMFDVDLADGESYRESSAFRPGEAAMTAQAGEARLGLSICYDLRFSALYRALAQAGAQILTIPAAFTVPTGKAHWHVLMRARAIETGCFVLAAAQTGTHAASAGPRRSTYGHSLAVGPWGEVLADGGGEPGVTLVDLDLDAVEKARSMVPALRHDRPFTGPQAG